MGEFCMPALGADMESGTVTEWRVRPGDRVARGDVIAVVETDKADLDVEVFESGVIDELLVAVGHRVPIGTPLARISAAGGQPVPEGAAIVPAATSFPATVPDAARVDATSFDEPAVAERGHAEAPQPVVGPLIRHLAEVEHVDLGAVRGTGQGGRMTRADVIGAASPRAVGPSARRKVTQRARRLARERGISLDDLDVPPDRPVTGEDVVNEPAALRSAPTPVSADAAGPAARRAAIARLMSRAAREIPHYYVATRIPLDAAMHWLDDHNATAPIADRVLPAALLLRAVALAAEEVPELNGEWCDDGFRPAAGVHLGVAVALRDGGLLTPTIHDAGRKGVPEMMAELRDLVTRARSGHLRPRELTGATLTVTNLGEQGVETVFGVIVPPQVALVGFGAIRDEPWAEHGMVGARPVVHASLAADHRATDGRAGARFLDVVARKLQHPEEL
jgi:pyruvate dehydrogenase E2 component (dihydrolipoamide acetyltransferase)